MEFKTCPNRKPGASVTWNRVGSERNGGTLIRTMERCDPHGNENKFHGAHRFARLVMVLDASLRYGAGRHLSPKGGFKFPPQLLVGGHTPCHQRKWSEGYGHGQSERCSVVGRRTRSK